MSVESQKILKALQSPPHCLSRTEVSELFSRNKAAIKLNAAIDELFDLGLIAIETRTTPGKNLTVYHALYVEDAGEGESSSSSSYDLPASDDEQGDEGGSQ